LDAGDKARQGAVAKASAKDGKLNMAMRPWELLLRCDACIRAVVESCNPGRDGDKSYRCLVPNGIRL